MHGIWMSLKWTLLVLDVVGLTFEVIELSVTTRNVVHYCMPPGRLWAYHIHHL